MEFVGTKRAGKEGSVVIQLAVGSFASFARVALSHIDKSTLERELLHIKSLTESLLAEWEISNETLDRLRWGVVTFEIEVTTAALSGGTANLLLAVFQDGEALPAEDDNDQLVNNPPDDPEVDLGEVPVPSLRLRAFRIFFKP